jgi:uncharacterized repeat protein (TIGR03803 family)
VPNDAAHPAADLVQASDGDFLVARFFKRVRQVGVPARFQDNGNFYGTIPVFESQDGYALSVGTSCCGALIHSFGIGDGINPIGALVQGPNGNLYGATTAGGTGGKGTIFEISTDGSVYKVLHDFGDGTVPNDGAIPNGGLILGQDGNLYGTTYEGGSAGLGTIFRITP